MRTFSGYLLTKLGGVVILAVFLSSIAYIGQAVSNDEEQFDFANGLYARKFCDMAAVEYQKFINKFPNSPQRELALYRLADCYRIIGKEDEAIRMYQEQLESFPNGQRMMHARYRLSELLLEKKYYEDASLHLEGLIAMPDANTLKEVCLLKLGDCYQNMDMPQKAILTWSKIDQQGEIGASAVFMMGSTFLKQGQEEKALAYFKKIAAKKESPLCPEASFRIGEILYKLERYSDSRKAYIAAAQFISSDFFIPSVLGLLWADYRKGDFKQGRKDFNKYRNSISGERLAEGLFLAGKFCEVEKDFRKAAETFALARNSKSGTRYVEACFFRRLWCLLKLGDDKQVVNEGKEFLNSFPQSDYMANVFFLIGEATCKLGDYERALSYFKRCLERTPPSQFVAEARFREGECYLQQKRWKSALTSFNAFTKAFPNHPLSEEALLHLAESQKELSDFQTASKTLEDLLSTYPNTQHRERSLYLLGVCYAQQGRFNELKELYEKLLLFNPESPYSGDVHYWVGLADMKNGNYDEARVQFKTVVNNYSKNPFFKNALLRLAQCSYILGDKEKAAAHFFRLMSIDRLPIESYLWLGQYLRESKRWEEALKTYDLLEKNYPSGGQWHEKMLYGKGKAHFALKQWDETAKYFSALIDNFPESSAACEYKLLLGISLRNLKKYNLGESFLLEAAKSTDPAIASQAQFELGNVCFDRKDFPGASRLYMRVFILYDHPDFSPKAQLGAGRCFELMKKPEEAANCYRELIKRYPVGAYAEEAKKRLEVGQ